jgi:release factor glutamine methyltransferase
LNWTRERFSETGIPEPRVDAEHLLAHALGCGRMDLYLQHDRLLDPDERAPFRALVKRRLAREPVAYIEGRRGFHALDLELSVDPRVLIPRPETEHLVDWLLETLRPPPALEQHVLDVGTGSGAIALAVARARDDVAVMGVDVSEDALVVARANAERVGLDVEFGSSDLLTDAPIPDGGWDVIAANLPYIPSAELETLQPEVRRFEPPLALDGGPDGLDLIDRLIESCPPRGGPLARGGALFLEIGAGQAEAVLERLRARGWEHVETRDDYSGHARVVRARAAVDVDT